MPSQKQLDDEATTIVDFVKVKSWYIPADSASYKKLRSLKIPILKVHQNHLPTLKLILDRKGIKARGRNWDSVFDDFVFKITDRWATSPARSASVGAKTLVFKSKILPKTDEHLSTLETHLKRFFSRWAFDCDIEIKKNALSVKLICTFSFNKEKNPIISLDDEFKVRESKLNLNSLHRLVFTVGDSPANLVFRHETRSGDEHSISSYSESLLKDLNTQELEETIQFLFFLLNQSKAKK